MPCGKIIHASAHAAQRALAAVKRRSRQSKEGAAGAYFCEACDGWHWGNQSSKLDSISRRRPIDTIASEAGNVGVAASPRDAAPAAASVVRAACAPGGQ